MKCDKYFETEAVRILFKMVAFQMLKNNKREINPRVLRKNAIYLQKGQGQPSRENLGKYNYNRTRGTET